MWWPGWKSGPPGRWPTWPLWAAMECRRPDGGPELKYPWYMIHPSHSLSLSLSLFLSQSIVLCDPLVRVYSSLRTQILVWYYGQDDELLRSKPKAIRHFRQNPKRLNNRKDISAKSRTDPLGVNFPKDNSTGFVGIIPDLSNILCGRFRFRFWPHHLALLLPTPLSPSIIAIFDLSKLKMK